jgi:hypothetical protein
MGRRVTLAVGTALAGITAAALGACGSIPERPEPGPSTTTASPSDPGETANVREHENGPESPIAYGFRVPTGASQVGPLIRSRSERLLEAYRPELEAAEARRDAEAMRRLDEREASGSPVPPQQPTPEPTEQPTEDTYGRLKAPPKPDTTISVMRIDGRPTDVVRAMLAQIDVILPKAGIVRTDIRKYCESQRRRVVNCHVEAAGRTPAGRTIDVTMHVDPGNFRTRTSPPATNQQPVMYLRVAYVGDPREGQANRRGDSNIEVPASVNAPDPSQLIWPKMDLDASRSSRLLNGWRAPLKKADLLLSGYTPAFAVLSAAKAADASAIARQYALGVNENAAVDVVEDLNEITTTYTATAPDGGVATASYILSARGYYAVLFYDPPAAPAPEATATTVSAVQR